MPLSRAKYIAEMTEGTSIVVPTGTTAERSATPEEGMMRLNSDTNQLEAYNVNGWQNISSSLSKTELVFYGSLE